jgi:GNAT superfamily N-acetyltransferase
MITYREIDESVHRDLINRYGNWLEEGIRISQNAFAYCAMDGEIPVGFVCVTSRLLTEPLAHLSDAYIEVLGVYEPYRRKGIAVELIRAAEKWAVDNGFGQIRTHSDHLSPEAIQMWHAFGYGLCPANDWLENKQMYWPGYHVVKVL